MTKSIVITGASKGIGRAAADALAEQGWTVIGVARSAPQSFPGEFISADLADQDQTGALANELAAHGNVLGIVNNVGLAKHETIDAVESPCVHCGHGFECPPSPATHASSTTGYAISTIWPHYQRDEPCDARVCVSCKLRSGESGTRKPHAHYGA